MMFVAWSKGSYINQYDWIIDQPYGTFTFCQLHDSEWILIQKVDDDVPPIVGHVPENWFMA